jgi:hypothetical protein
MQFVVYFPIRFFVYCTCDDVTSDLIRASPRKFEHRNPVPIHNCAIGIFYTMTYANGATSEKEERVGTSSIVDDTGKTRLLKTLQRAQAGGAPSVGQWMEFPGYTLARTIAGLGPDVSPPHRTSLIAMSKVYEHD